MLLIHYEITNISSLNYHVYLYVIILCLFYTGCNKEVNRIFQSETKVLVKKLQPFKLQIENIIVPITLKLLIFFMRVVIPQNFQTFYVKISKLFCPLVLLSKNQCILKYGKYSHKKIRKGFYVSKNQKEHNLVEKKKVARIILESLYVE